TIAAMGTSALAIGVAVTAFAIGYKPWKGGWWARVRSHWNVGLTVVVGAWFLVFACNAASVVYNDHRSLTAQLTAARNETRAIQIAFDQSRLSAAASGKLEAH